MHGLVLRKGAKADKKFLRIRKRLRMQFGIAARQPADVAIGRRRFITQWREGHDLRPRLAPALQMMGVDEGEGDIAGERDALARRRQRQTRMGSSGPRGKRNGADGVEIHMGLHQIGHAVENYGEALGFARLHKAQMSLGQAHLPIARNGAEHWHARAGNGVGDEATVTLAADLVENDARNGDARIIAHAALHDGAGGLRLAAHIQHQQHRPARGGRNIDGGAAASFGRGHPIEEPHQPLAERQVRALPGLQRERGQQGGLHGPGVEVEAGAARRHAVKGRVDIIRPAFQPAHPHAPACECAQQAQRQRGLAAGGAGRGDDEAGRGWLH